MRDNFDSFRTTIGRSLPTPVTRRLLRRSDWQRTEGTAAIPWIWPWLVTSINQVRFGSSIPEPGSLIWIDPSTVQWLLVPRYLVPATNGTYVYGGNWDRSYSDASIHFKGSSEGFTWPTLINLQNYTFFQSLKNHFHEGVDWSETELYRAFSTQDLSLQYNGTDGLLNRLTEIDQLYESIAMNGYQTQRELLEESNVPRQNSINTTNPSRSEVMVNIGRDGEIIFCTGRHRFIIARLLELPTIPVRVHVRHSRWQERRQRAIAGTTTISHNLVNHPDFADVIESDELDAESV